MSETFYLMATVYKRKGRPCFYAEFNDSMGRRVRRSTGSKVKRDAQLIANKWESDANSLRHGIADTTATLSSLVEEYLNYLAGSSKSHYRGTVLRLNSVIEETAWTRPNQISQLGVETSVRNLRNLRDNKPLASRTQSHYLAAWKSFTKWLVNVRKALPADPLAAIKKPSFTQDRRLVRRFLHPEEWKWLKLTPYAVLYETAIQTGFRAGEIAELTEASLRDDHLFLSGKFTKNNQDAIQYITPSLHEKLQGSLPLSLPPGARLADRLKRDLGIARFYAGNDGSMPEGGLVALNNRGEVLDFHALRHTCGAWLAIHGTPPKIIQSVMRHSSIALTLDTYGHLMPGAERDAVQAFDKILNPGQ